MTSPDERADEQTRSAALDLVESAFRAGRIVQADRAMRVDQLRWARTVQDVDLIVRDLRHQQSAAAAAAAAVSAPLPAPTPARATTAPAPAAPSAPAEPWPLVGYGPPQGGTAAPVALATAKRGGRAIGAVIAVVVLVAIILPVAGVVIALASSRDTFPTFEDLAPTDDTTYVPGQTPGENGVNVHTVAGYEALVEALRAETGDVYAYSAVLYPRYAVVEVPTGTNDRYQNYYWDGRELALQDFKSTSTDDQVDLSLVEPQMLVDTLADVRSRVEDPTSWYVVISDPASSETQLIAHASNDFGEDVYVVKALDGTVVYDSENP